MTAFAVDWHVDASAMPSGDGSATRPFATLEAAFAAMPGGPAETMVVHLAPGIHRVESPLVLAPRHTRGKPLRIDGGGSAVISGGVRLKHWQAADHRWTHVWDGGPVRELFVNGERRTRARFPKEGWLRVAEALPDKRSGFIAQENLPAVGTGAELLFLHDWSVSRIPVATVTGTLLKTAGPIGFPAAHYAIDHFEPHPRYCLENDPSFLTEKGGWCFDPAKRQLVYLPRDGENPVETVVEVPVASGLLMVAGTAEQAVCDVGFEGITFELCRWEIPSTGYAEGQATQHVPRNPPTETGGSHGQWEFAPWAIHVERADRIAFRHCRFRNMGGSGILLGPATKECLLENCLVADISGNGIGIGEGGERHLADGTSWWKSAPQEAAMRNLIQNCLIERCGAQFHGAVGIWVGLAKDTRIIGNEVRHLPYTGISVGWMWNAEPTPCGGNMVEGNHIHHIMQLLSDGGGIYTLGRQTGTVLRDNLIHDVPLNAGRAESNGMFLDEGSSEFLIDGNVIHSTDRSPLRFHKASNITVRGNLWSLTDKMPPLRFNNTDPATIDAHDNSGIEPAAKAGIIESWMKKHPAPSAR